MHLLCHLIYLSAENQTQLYSQEVPFFPSVFIKKKSNFAKQMELHLGVDTKISKEDNIQYRPIFHKTSEEFRNK